MAVEIDLQRDADFAGALAISPVPCDGEAGDAEPLTKDLNSIKVPLIVHHSLSKRPREPVALDVSGVELMAIKFQGPRGMRHFAQDLRPTGEVISPC